MADRMKTCWFRGPDELLKWIEEKAAKAMMTQSSFVRMKLAELMHLDNQILPTSKVKH